MNYESHYLLLVERAKNRPSPVVFERHHIVPRCMGGTDDKINLVDLTPEEHFLAHQLLVKIHPSVEGLAYACMKMAGNPHGHRRNKVYGWLRRKHAQDVSKRMLGNKYASRKMPEEEKIIRAVKNKQHYELNPRSEEHSRKIAESNATHYAARKRKCTIDGITIFNGVREMGKSLGQGKNGTRSPDFRYIQ